MSVLIKNMEMPKGCIYANDNDQTEYCPLLNHDDVPFCQYIESEPEIAIGIDERPVYCPLSDVPEPCENTVSRQAAIDAINGLEFCHYMEFGEYIGEDTREVRLIRAEKAQDTLQKLPSAQPELIHCRDCKWHNGEINQCSAQICASMRGEDFCSRAERRIDE